MTSSAAGGDRQIASSIATVLDDGQPVDLNVTDAVAARLWLFTKAYRRDVLQHVHLTYFTALSRLWHPRLAH
jgi:hypothetical protein